MSLYSRCPALALSYEDLIKRIRHTGTVIVERADGSWYHSGDSRVVKSRIKKIKSILDDTYINEKLSPEAREFEKFLVGEIHE